MTLSRHQLLKLSLYIGVLALIVRIPTVQTSNPSQIVTNGLQLNALTFNSQDLSTAVTHEKGTLTHQQTEYHPDWINRHQTQATLKHQTVEAIGVENGQLTLQLSE